MRGGCLLRRPPARLVVVVVIALATVTPAALAADRDAANGQGSGNLRATFSQRQVNRDRLCFSAVVDIESYLPIASEPAYVAEYAIGGLTYHGPVTLDLHPFVAYQNAQGSFSDIECQLKTFGAPAKIPGGTLRGGLANRHVSCVYQSGTWRRMEEVITMTLEGRCTVTVDGVASATAPTSELHEGVGYFAKPHHEPGGPDPNDDESFPFPPDSIMWEDSFVAPSPRGDDPLPPKPLGSLPPNLPPLP